MEISTPVPTLGFDLKAQLRFFCDRHFVIVTDSVSNGHGTVFQVEATADPTAGTSNAQMDFDDFEFDAPSASSSASAKPPVLNVEVTPLLGGSRDNQLELLLARRIVTVISETMSGNRSNSQQPQQPGLPPLKKPRQQQQPSAAAAPVVLLMTIHLPKAMSQPQNGAHAMSAVKALEAKLRDALAVATPSA